MRMAHTRDVRNRLHKYTHNIRNMQEGERTNERSEGLPLANGAFGNDDKLKGER